MQINFDGVKCAFWKWVTKLGINCIYLPDFWGIHLLNDSDWLKHLRAIKKIKYYIKNLYQYTQRLGESYSILAGNLQKKLGLKLDPKSQQTQSYITLWRSYSKE